MKKFFVTITIFTVIISFHALESFAELAEDGEFPHQVHITLYGALVGALLVAGWCSGSIIATEWVITAAHCVSRKPNPLPFLVVAFHVKAGSVTTFQSRQQSTLLLSDAHVHPDYDFTTLENDIALLKTSPFDFSTTFVKPIALPLISLNILDILGATAKLSGFGLTSYNLHWIQLQLISKTACQAFYNDPITRSSFCAENPTMEGSVCPFDSGAPLTVSLLGLTTLIGVASYSGGCIGSAHGFTNVSQFVLWIYQTMLTNSFDIK